MDGLVQLNGRLYTLNLSPGNRIYGERTIQHRGQEYREWDPRRSKLAAYLIKGGTGLELSRNSRVLYLGAASGTTASHISDLVPDGAVYCVEFSPRSFRDLIRNCDGRPNMMPLLGDATKPQVYATMVPGVDLVYQDVAQKGQARILKANMDAFHADRGMLALKSRSEDVTKEPRSIYANSVAWLRSSGLVVQEVLELDPFEKDHAMMVVIR
jgi:fibrillarin-like pre-rRNA processing protein